jgi:tetratricopeptide (TPR) repeat protein
MALGLPTLAVSVMKFAEARSALTAVALLPVELPAEMEVGRLYATALMCGCLGLDEEGFDWLLRALPVARDRGGQEALARCLIDLGFCLGRLGRPDEGLPYAEEGLALAAAEDGSRFLSPGLLTVGVLSGQLGDLDRQRTAFDEVLRRIRPPVQGPDVVRRTMLARSLRETGQLEDAVEVLQLNQVDVRELGLDVIEADVLVELGAVHLAMGDIAHALEVLDVGLRIASRYPAEHREAPLLKLFGEALAAVGKADEAREMWQRAVVLYDREADTRAAQVRSLLAEV